MVTSLSLSLSPTLGASGAARAAVRDRFSGVLTRDTLSDLELVISELVGNGVEHGRGSIRVEVTHAGEELGGSVSDDGDGFAYELRPVATGELRGRGLAIVDAIVSRWGTRGGRTHIWFVMAPQNR